MRSFFEKLKKWLGIGVDKNKQLDESKENVNEIVDVKIDVPDFKENLYVEEDGERLKIINLQQQYKEGKIKQEDLTEEDIDKLIALYDEQIEKVKQEIEEKKIKIENMKNKKN